MKYENINMKFTIYRYIKAPNEVHENCPGKVYKLYFEYVNAY